MKDFIIIIFLLFLDSRIAILKSELIMDIFNLILKISEINIIFFNISVSILFIKYIKKYNYKNLKNCILLVQREGPLEKSLLLRNA